MNEGSGRRQLSENEQRTVSRWVTAEFLAGVAVFLVEPFFWLNGLRTAGYTVLALDALFFVVGFIRLGRLTGMWWPRVRPSILRGFRPVGGQQHPGEVLHVVTSALGTWAPFTRTDLLFYASGIATVRWGSAHLKSARARVRDERASSLEQLLARDRRNRFVPWQDLAAVRLPGAFGPYRATFELRDGSRFRLWATSDALSHLERDLANFTNGGYASETSSRRSSLQ
jgi:hypothetical protein